MEWVGKFYLRRKLKDRRHSVLQIGYVGLLNMHLEDASFLLGCLRCYDEQKTLKVIDV